jgi:hypothetical protein
VTQVLQGVYVFHFKDLGHDTLLRNSLANRCTLWMLPLLPLCHSSTRYRLSPRWKCECQNGTSISIVMIEESPLHSHALPTFVYVLLFINSGT